MIMMTEPLKALLEEVRIHVQILADPVLAVRSSDSVPETNSEGILLFIFSYNSGSFDQCTPCL